MILLNTPSPQEDSKTPSYFRFFLEALFPKKCLFCFEEGEHLCQKHRKIPAFSSTKKYLPSLDSVLIACDYNSVHTKKIIEFFKFKGFSDLSQEIAQEIIKKIEREKSQEFFSDFVLVPVSLHWTRKLWRGYNQSEILAQELQKHLKIPISTSLKRIKRTKQQVRLQKIHRFENTKNAFEWIPEKSIYKKFLGFFLSSSSRRRGSRLFSKLEIKAPEKILLIDDVCTTGATLESATLALKKAGAKEVAGVVFAGGS